MLSSVVYHESLHQDFQEHNSAFDNKAKLFPKYNELNKKLEDFSAKVHSEIETEARDTTQWYSRVRFKIGYE